MSKQLNDHYIYKIGGRIYSTKSVAGDSFLSEEIQGYNGFQLQDKKVYSSQDGESDNLKLECNLSIDDFKNFHNIDYLKFKSFRIKDLLNSVSSLYDTNFSASSLIYYTEDKILYKSLSDSKEVDKCQTLTYTGFLDIFNLFTYIQHYGMDGELHLACYDNCSFLYSKKNSFIVYKPDLNGYNFRIYNNCLTQLHIGITQNLDDLSNQEFNLICN